jgi:hypothetical protein
MAATLADRERAVGLLRDAIAQGPRGPWHHAGLLFASLRGYAPFEELWRPRD